MSSSEKKIFLLDGGLGTTLKDNFNADCDGTLHPLWSSDLLISAPQTLQAAQTQFAKAGADIILTGTYQASFEGFKHTRLPERYAQTGVEREEAKEFMRDGVDIARKAFEETGRRGLVALSLGAYGAVMVPSQEYSGLYDEKHSSIEELCKWHSERLEVFSGHDETWDKVDMVAFETIPTLNEVLAVRDCMFDVNGPDKESRSVRTRPFWISCVFPGEDDCLPDGTEVEVLVEAMLGVRKGAAIPHAIGLNCTKTHKVSGLVGKFEQAIKRLKDNGKIDREILPSLVIYPDGTRGEVYNTTTCMWEKKMDDLNMAPWDKQIYDIVIEKRHHWDRVYVGGCCKTGPAEIEALRQRLDTHK